MYNYPAQWTGYRLDIELPKVSPQFDNNQHSDAQNLQNFIDFFLGNHVTVSTTICEEILCKPLRD